MKLIKLFKIIFVLVISLSCSIIFAASTSFTAEQNKAIEQVVHDYLVNNPEVLVEAMKKLQEKQEAQMEQETKKSLTQNAKEIFDASNKPIAGNPKGKIIIAEMFDYRCPHCKVMHPVIEQIIKANPDLEVIFIEIPIFGEDSEYIVKASLASMKQNKYAEFHAALLNSKNTLKKEDILNIAKSIGINIDQLQKDIENKDLDKQIEKNIELAKKMQISGTPAFLIGNLKSKKYDFIYGQTSLDILQAKINAVK